MRRKLGILALLFSASVLLSACDKCGEFPELKLPSVPKSCSGDGPR